MRKKIKIGDLGNIITGKTPPTSSKKYYGDFALFIKPTDISDDLKHTFVTEEMYSEEAAEKYATSLVPEGAICVPCIGTIGTKMTITHCDCFTNQSINSIVCNESYDSEYVYYLIKDFLPNLKLYNLGTASGREYISKTNFEKIEIWAEQELSIQKKIGKVLSAYDDLIENNRSQISLLEEAAQRLYNEWFVNYNYPGSDCVAIKDGLPEGWKKTLLTDDIVPILTGKKDANFGGKEGKYYFFTCAQEPIRANSYSFDTSAVILAGNGDFNVKLYRGQFEAYQRTYVLSPRNLKYLYTLYFCVEENMRQLAAGSRGSTIKFLTKGMIEKLEMTIPSDNILEQFNKNCEAIMSRIEVLKEQIAFAQEARDMLLPRLIDGTIEL